MPLPHPMSKNDDDFVIVLQFLIHLIILFTLLLPNLWKKWAIVNKILWTPPGGVPYKLPSWMFASGHQYIYIYKNYSKIQLTTDNSNLQGKILKNVWVIRNLSLYQDYIIKKWPEGKTNLLGVSGRFELLRVWVTMYGVSQLYTCASSISSN